MSKRCPGDRVLRPFDGSPPTRTAPRERCATAHDGGRHDMERNSYKSAVWTLGLALSSLAAPCAAGAAAALPVHVTLQGLSAELEHNVRAHLEIAEKRGKVSEAEARELDEKARSEIGLGLE